MKWLQNFIIILFLVGCSDKGAVTPLLYIPVDQTAKRALRIKQYTDEKFDSFIDEGLGCHDENKEKKYCEDALSRPKPDKPPHQILPTAKKTP